MKRAATPRNCASPVAGIAAISLVLVGEGYARRGRGRFLRNVARVAAMIIWIVREVGCTGPSGTEEADAVSALPSLSRRFAGCAFKAGVYLHDGLHAPSPQRRQVVDNDFPNLSPVDLIVLVSQPIADAADIAPWLVGDELLWPVRRVSSPPH